MSSKIAASESIAKMVTEWVETGIKLGTDWRNGLPGIIEKRLARFAAPVVERQDAIGTLLRVGQVIVFDVIGDPHIKDGMEVFTAPPELAELQATINKLTAENEALSDECGINDKEIEGLQSALADAESEIERLKSGPGEPVGIVAHRVNEIGQSFEGVIYATPILMGLVEGGMLLYASQPAPVSVVLPSHSEMHILISKAARKADLTSGANYYTAAEFAAISFLDKVKELNQ